MTHDKCYHCDGYTHRCNDYAATPEGCAHYLRTEKTIDTMIRLMREGGIDGEIRRSEDQGQDMGQSEGD